MGIKIHLLLVIGLTALVATALYAVNYIGSRENNGDHWTSIGLQHMDDGRLDLAATDLQEARDAFIIELGDDDPETIRSTRRLLAVYEKSFQTANALPLAESLHRQMTRIYGDESVEALRATRDLAEIYRLIGRFDDSVRLNRWATTLVTAKFGPNVSETLAISSNLAKSYWDLGRKQEAIELLSRTANLYRQKLGGTNDSTIESMVTLSRWYHDSGDCDSARSVLAELEPVMVKKFGLSHSETERIRTVISLLDAAPHTAKGCLNAYR